MSLLTRGAWIEIFGGATINLLQFCRSSPEERGLKLKWLLFLVLYILSLLTRGAWIEI